MGNTLSCCLCPHACRQRGRRSGSAESDKESEGYVVAPQDAGAVVPSPADLEPTELDFGASEGNHTQQHSSEPEMPQDSESEASPSDHLRASPILPNKSEMEALESSPSDHSRASSVFQSEAQMDGDDTHFASVVTVRARTVQEKEKTNHVWRAHVTKKYSSCSTIFLDDSTARQPNLERTIHCVSLAIYYIIKNRDGNRSLDIFDERAHPLTQEEDPQEYYEDGHDPDPELISKFLHTVFNVTGLTPGCAIITWIYLERVFLFNEINISPNNWKKMVLGAILASTIWVNEPLRNKCYCEILMDITAEDMDEIKRIFLVILNGHLTISRRLYNKYYFEARSVTCDDMMCTSTPLTKQRAQELEAISGLCEDDDYNDLCGAAMTRSLSADNVIVFQQSNAILS